MSGSSLRSFGRLVAFAYALGRMVGRIEGKLGVRAKWETSP